MVELQKYRAILFDLDGVLTPTAELHMQAWATLFGEYFTQKQLTQPGIDPYTDQDYLQYVDGMPRYIGVQNVLESRQIELPWGDSDDPDTAETICGLGNRKNTLFRALLGAGSLAPYPGSLAFLHRVLAVGKQVAVVSSSKNARDVLLAAGILDLFPVIIDGLAVEQGHLQGKPHPDMFLAAAEALSVHPHKAVVIEDAQVGVAAGVSGDFGLVIGVNRGDATQRELLRAAGADLVVNDLAELGEATLSTPDGVDES